MIEDHRPVTEEQHHMDMEPENDNGEIGRSLKNFFIAAVFIVVFSVVSVLGLYQLARFFPERVPWSTGQKLSGKSLPDDIPLYSGAVLAESQDSGDRLTFTYMLPLGARTTAHDFYAAEMINNGWSRLASDGEFLEFYKQGGKRRAIIKIQYLNGKAALLFEITGNEEQ